MSTWHQQQARTKLYHKTEWTVVIDPPNDTRCCVLFEHERDANDYMRKLQDRGERVYILPPAKV